MLHRMVFPGKYFQGVGATRELPSLVKIFGSQALILASPTVQKNVLPECGIDLRENALLTESFGRECSERELSRIADIIRQKRVDVMIGMGGGKTIDTAKIAADRASIPVIIVPTIAATDAPCSGCAVIYSDEGVFERVCYQKSNPAAVIVDTQVIAKAPARFLVSGMGDALSTWFEANSCHRTQSRNECGGLSTSSGMAIARLCYDTLLQYGVSARIACERQLITPAFERIVEANILMSGLGFESGGLASAHSIHNGLTALGETHAYYHGEKVAFGVLAGLQLTDATPEESQAVFSFCERVGLPTTLADLGILEVSREKLMPVAEKACLPTEGIHHEAGEMTPEKVLQAILAANAIGEQRKAQAR